MIQNGSQVTLEFTVRDYDMVSENYAKAMIQTLMFLLQWYKWKMIFFTVILDIRIWMILDEMNGNKFYL